MGICLDTAAAPVVGPATQPDLKSYSSRKTTRLTAHFPYRGVKRPPAPLYRPTGVVVYVLGGPGTGKVTLSQAVAQGSQGRLCHVSMTKVMQDYAKHFDLANSSCVPSATAADMLTARLKASSSRLGFIVSGFPRNLDDVVECSKKISRLDGVILLDHRPEMLEQLVKDGIQSGDLTNETGEQELSDFLSHIIPLTDVMRNKDVLYKISVVDCDLNDIVMQMETIIQKLMENSSTLHPDQNQNNDSHLEDNVGIFYCPMWLVSDKDSHLEDNVGIFYCPMWLVSDKDSHLEGGPGSNKSNYCEAVVSLYPGWTHLSCSWMLRDLVTDEAIRDSVDVLAVRQLLVTGELVPQGLIINCLCKAMEQNASSRGFIISGFPRDLQQLEEFELEHGRQSDIVLIDCSELELGRTLGRREDIDDTVRACRRRLELYRIVSLPAMKALDETGRLLVIDGDCDEVQVLDELKRCTYLELQQLLGHGPNSAVGVSHQVDMNTSAAWPTSIAKAEPAGVAEVAAMVDEVGGGATDGTAPVTVGTSNHRAAGGSVDPARGDTGPQDDSQILRTVSDVVDDIRRRSVGLGRTVAAGGAAAVSEVEATRSQVAR